MRRFSLAGIAAGFAMMACFAMTAVASAAPAPATHDPGLYAISVASAIDQAEATTLQLSHVLAVAPAADFMPGAAAPERRSRAMAMVPKPRGAAAALRIDRKPRPARRYLC